MRIAIYSALALLTASFAPVHAGQKIMQTSDKKEVTPEDEFPYTAGTKGFEVAFGGFASFDTYPSGRPTRPDTNYLIGETRFGVMVYNPKGSGFFRGNVEVMLEGFGGSIFDGPGSDLFGGELLIRYNFVQPQARLVPFFQIGGGGVYSDAAFQDRVQRLIGSKWSFNLEGELGLRYMLTRRTALEVGMEYRHISNADTASRNRGLNSLGGEIGFNVFF